VSGPYQFKSSILTARNPGDRLNTKFLRRPGEMQAGSGRFGCPWGTQQRVIHTPTVGRPSVARRVVPEKAMCVSHQVSDQQPAAGKLGPCSCVGRRWVDVRGQATASLPHVPAAVYDVHESHRVRRTVSIPWPGRSPRVVCVGACVARYTD